MSCKSNSDSQLSCVIWWGRKTVLVSFAAILTSDCSRRVKYARKSGLGLRSCLPSCDTCPNLFAINVPLQPRCAPRSPRVRAKPPAKRRSLLAWFHSLFILTNVCHYRLFVYSYSF